jgi:hypothetical protein
VAQIPQEYVSFEIRVPQDRLASRIHRGLTTGLPVILVTIGLFAWVFGDPDAHWLFYAAIAIVGYSVADIAIGTIRHRRRHPEMSRTIFKIASQVLKQRGWHFWSQLAVASVLFASLPFVIILGVAFLYLWPIWLILALWQILRLRHMDRPGLGRPRALNQAPNATAAERNPLVGLLLIFLGFLAMSVALLASVLIASA